MARVKTTPKEPAFPLIDIKGGEFTYGQRIELGGILANKQDRPEHELFLETIELMYGRKPTVSEYKEAIKAFRHIVEGLVFWIELESRQLKYEPTQEEKDAGLERYAAEVGELGTAYALAKEFAKDPDEILLWKYGKVFGYLRKQKADGDFQRRYSAVLARKAKSK